MNANPPAEIRLHKKSSTLELVFANDIEYQLSAEYLRVHSPSAEVRGHGQGQEILQTGKRQVKLLNIEP
ncbi:MAG: gamma-butyrobetaine hydroxylase-like domain-containing protein, partial [Pseudohongiellaceae bacterium]